MRRVFARGFVGSHRAEQRKNQRNLPGYARGRRRWPRNADLRLAARSWQGHRARTIAPDVVVLASERLRHGEPNRHRFKCGSLESLSADGLSAHAAILGVRLGIRPLERRPAAVDLQRGAVYELRFVGAKVERHMSDLRRLAHPADRLPSVQLRPHFFLFVRMVLL